MIIFSIGTDKNIFNKNSAVFFRVLEYSKLVDSFSVLVFTHKKDGFKDMRVGSFNVYPINYSFKFLSFFNLYFLFKKILKNNNFNRGDCLISSQDPFEVGFFSWILAKLFKLKLEIQVHIDFYNRYYRKEKLRFFLQFFLAKFLLKRGDQLRVVSLRIKKYLIENLKIRENKIIHLPIIFDNQKGKVESNSSCLKEKYPQFDFIILMASRFVLQKNIALAIKSFEKISINFKKIALVIIGSGPEEEKIKELAKNNKNIIFESWVNNLSDYYGSSDIFLLTSNYEGWGMTVVEASSYGLPVVMTDVGCAGEFVKNNYNGIICKVEDKKEIVKALTYLIENREKREEISNQAYQSYQDLLKINYLQKLKDSWQNLFLSK